MNLLRRLLHRCTPPHVSTLDGGASDGAVWTCRNCGRRWTIHYCINGIQIGDPEHDDIVALFEDDEYLWSPWKLKS